MAITKNGNSVYVDTTGQVTTTGKPVFLHYLVYTTSAAGDTLTLKDTDNSGNVKMTIKHNTATDSLWLDFSESPIRFPGGIYCSAISASSLALVVISDGAA